MISADDILMPYPLEVIKAKQQKRLDKFDALYPGIIQKTKEWMESEKYKCLHGPREVNKSYAPLIVINKMVVFTDMQEWVVGGFEDDDLVDIANMLWVVYVMC